MKLKIKYIKFIVASQIIISLFILSCNNRSESKEENQTIIINPKEVSKQINISEFADSVKYIKLQTNPNCIIGSNIAEVLIKKKYIYVCDASQMKIFIFYKDGNFVGKLDKRGKGPEEYLHFAGMFVDEDEEYIEVFTRQGELLKYSNITFKFIEKKTLKQISSNYSLKVNNIYYFSAQQNRNVINKKVTNADIIIAKNGKIKTLFEKKINTNNNTFVPSSNLLVLNEDNELFTSILYSNTFYKLRGFNAFPILKLDFGGYDIKESLRIKPVQEQKDYLFKIPAGKAFMPVLTLNNSNIMAFHYAYSEQKGRISKQEYIILKKQGKAYQTNIIKNDLTSFPTIVTFSISSSQIPHQIWYENNLVNIIIPSKEFIYRPGESKMEVEGLGTINPGDNPIIVLYKFKNDLL
ncbi:MAG: 6-bladed beta-propeller [Cyclobacteriaceae bacterium]